MGNGSEIILPTSLERRIVTIPYSPRNWAKKLHETLLRWIVLVLHRRGGKTTAVLNHHQRYALDDEQEAKRLLFLNPAFTHNDIVQLLKRRTYWHVMPTAHQARVTGAWDTLQEISRGVPNRKPNQQLMSVKYPNGSTLQLLGADTPDSLRGPALSGLSLDEYSQIASYLYGEILSKALADHLGYCIWSGTIKGKDQLHKTYDAAKYNPEWFSLWQNVNQSLASEVGATIKAIQRAMEDERKQVLDGIISQAEYDQEWFLSAEAAIKGAFYGDQMRKARETGRIARVPYDAMLPVDTDWDLGIDAMAVWFSQSTKSGEVRLIDYYEDVGGGLEVAIKAVKGQLPNVGDNPKIREVNARRANYTYGEHWAPHDIEVREISSGKTRKQLAHELGLTFKVTPKLPISDGITATQMFLERCYFDEVNAGGGVSCLQHYQRTWQERLSQFTETPLHNVYSHGADAFRGLAVRHKTPKDKQDMSLPRFGRVSSAYS